MKSISKYICTGLAACCLLTAPTACTDLDETIYSDLSSSNVDMTDETNLSQILGSCLVNYRNTIGAWFGMMMLVEESTDQMVTVARQGIGFGDKYLNLHKHDWGIDVGQIQNSWEYAFPCILYANTVLDATAEDAYETQAQVRFFRAMAYYHLMDLFGNPPLQTTMNIPAGYEAEQVGKDSLFNFIVDEFKYAEEHIGDSHNYGWANKEACEMALAKMYLNKNAMLGTTDNTGYEKALEYVQKVIDSGRYSLADNYLDNFKSDLSSCPEAIFVIPGDKTYAQWFGIITQYFYPQTGLYAFNSTAGGYNGSNAIPQFIDTYDADDQRLTDTWAGGTQYYGEGYKDKNGNDLSGQPIPFSDDDWSGTGYLTYSKEVHSVDYAYQQEGYRLKKFEIENGSNKGTSANDYAVFRYADALMIKAECLLRLGRDKETAASLVTQVRQRNFTSNPSKATRTSTQLEGGSCYNYGFKEYPVKAYNDWTGVVFNQEGGSDIELGGLLDDLGWEFPFEMHRRQDLRRFKMKDGRNVWNGKSWFCKNATTETKWDFFCIPLSVLKTNTNLTQNPGYATSADDTTTSE